MIISKNSYPTNSIITNMKYPTYFITSAPIRYSILNYDLYDSFDLVSKGIVPAPLAPEVIKTIKSFPFCFDTKYIEKIYTAEKGQTLETAKLLHSHIFKKAKILPIYLLNGVRFSMKQLISKREFNDLPFELALKKTRRNFIINLYKGKLIESFQSVNNRINQLLVLLEKEGAGTICISHSFYMKLVEIYISDVNNFKDQKKLMIAFDPEKKPYKPLTGFRLDNK